MWCRSSQKPLNETIKLRPHADFKALHFEVRLQHFEVAVLAAAAVVVVAAAALVEVAAAAAVVVDQQQQ